MFRPVDIYECSSDSDDEPTTSVASDVPTSAPGLPSQQVARIDRANPRNFGPGDIEELSPELWEEFRLDGAADEHDLYMQDLADEEAQGTEQDLDRPQTYLRPQDPPLLGRRSHLQTVRSGSPKP